MTLIFAGITLAFWLWSKKFKDIRTLRLGRLHIFFVLFLFGTLNFALASYLAFYEKNVHTEFFGFGLLVLGIEAVVLFLFPIIMGIVTPIAILILTIRMWRRESKSLANFILPILTLLFVVVDWLYLMTDTLSDSWTWLKILAFAYPILSVYLSWQFLVFFNSSWLYGWRMRKISGSHHVVLGAGLINGEKVGRLLGNRIKAATTVANDKTILVLSGGQGTDEKISEAEAMQKYAIEELDFPAERTIQENKSRTTYENLKYSAELIGDKFLFFTSDYHVFRAALFAKEQGLDVQGGRGGKTAIYYRVPAFIREFIAVMNSQRKKQIIQMSLLLGPIIIASAWTGIMQLLK